MHPTPKLRYVYIKNEVTAEMVNSLVKEWGLSMNQAKAELEDARGPVLQQWWAPDGTLTNKDGEWRDIKVEYIVLKSIDRITG